MHAGGGAIQSDGGDHGGALPASARRCGVQSLAARCSAPQPGHVGLGSALIKEDQPPGL